MPTLLQKHFLHVFQHHRREAAARSHYKTRKPTTLAVAVASPPANAAASDVPLRPPSDLTFFPCAPSTAPSAFLALGIDPLVADALPSIDVTRPSPIQAAALPAVLSGVNCAIQSYTGSGKTLSYLLPTLTLALRRAEKLAADPATPRKGGVPEVPVQVLVVAPSQELAMQIMRVAKSLLPGELRRYAVQQVIGGANPKRQAEALGLVPGPLVVVGTPGRLAEMIRSGSLRLHHCPVMVLDEADQLLASAFAEDINYINAHCGKKVSRPDPQPSEQPTAAAGGGGGGGVDGSAAASRRQTVLVSATLTPSALTRSASWCPDPRFVSAGAVPAVVAAESHSVDGRKDGENPSWGWGVRGWDGPASAFAPRVRGSAGGVESGELVPTMPPQLAHYYLVVEPRHKVDALRRAIHALGVQRALVFMNFQQRLHDAQFKLQARGMKAAALHGELPRLVRANQLNDFRRGRLRALVVSDVAARGIDIPSCDAVFHLELPSSAAHYAHRAGRTGRLSAALAAQVAAEAAAGASAAANGPVPRPSASVDVLEQAAGVVVTIVAPSERFVVDKLAAQLGVPLLEAHVSHGQLRLGPPPGGYSFDKDEESDRTEAAEPSDRASRRERRAGGGAAAAAAESDWGQREESTSGRSVGSAKAAGAIRSKSGSVAAAAAAAEAKKKKKGTATRGDDDKYEIIVDEDDDIILEGDEVGDADDAEDYEILDEDLQAFKRLRPAEVRQLGVAAAGVGTAAAASGRVAAAGIKLKGQRKQRMVPLGLEPVGQSGRGAAEVSTGSRTCQRREGPKGQGQGQTQEGPDGWRPASSRSEVMWELRRQLEELRMEREQQKQKQLQGRTRRDAGTKSP